MPSVTSKGAPMQETVAVPVSNSASHWLQLKYIRDAVGCDTSLIMELVIIHAFLTSLHWH